MEIKSIEFLCSSPSLRECPRMELPEFAFIGRSNVGKSSLINMLANRKGLAKISGTPGKTRLINHFLVQSTGNVLNTPDMPFSGTPAPSQQGGRSVQGSWFLVDLPGYGFAKISKEQREKFEGTIRTYLEKRETLAVTFVLIDSRLEPQKIDIEFMNWLGDRDIPFVAIFTKTDKLSKQEIPARLKSYKKILSEYWSELPIIIPTSSETRYGRDDILGMIEKTLNEIRFSEHSPPGAPAIP